LGDGAVDGLRGAAEVEGAACLYDGADDAQCVAQEEKGEAGAGGARVSLSASGEPGAGDGERVERYGEAHVRGLVGGAADGDGGYAADQRGRVGAGGGTAGCGGA